MPGICMDPRAHFKPQWRSWGFLRRGILTDKQIEKYQREGYYSAEFKLARKQLQSRQKRSRTGNFILDDDGRMIYSPL